MNENTKKKYLAFCIGLAAGYGVASVKDTFAATPTTAQKLVDKIVEQDKWLARINNIPVSELKGQKVLGSVGLVLPKRTNTTAGTRVPQRALSLGTKDYELFKTEFDFAMGYETVDAWAKFPDFTERYSTWLRKAIAMARVRVGWYGTHAAAVTNSTTYPLGQDVNKGWFQILREYNNGAQWFLEGATAGQIRIGAGGDFVNLDTAVHECLQMIDPLYREGTDLKVLIGSDLLAVDKASLYEAQGATPSEKERIANEKVSRTYAGLPVETPSGFPARGLMITSIDNFSWYYQDSAVRRRVIDNPSKDQVEEYSSNNEAYVLEDEAKAAGFEFANIRLKSGNSWI